MAAIKINIRMDDKLLSQLKEDIKSSGLKKKKYIEDMLWSCVKREARRRELFVKAGYNKKACYVVSIEQDLYFKVKRLAESFGVSLSDMIRYAIISHICYFFPLKKGFDNLG